MLQEQRHINGLLPQADCLPIVNALAYVPWKSRACYGCGTYSARVSLIWSDYTNGVVV